MNKKEVEMSMVGEEGELKILYNKRYNECWKFYKLKK